MAGASCSADMLGVYLSVAVSLRSLLLRWDNKNKLLNFQSERICIGKCYYRKNYPGPGCYRGLIQHITCLSMASFTIMTPGHATQVEELGRNLLDETLQTVL